MFEPLMLTFGLASCILAALLTSKLQMVDSSERRVLIFARMISYLPWITWEVIKSNIEVARRIWQRDMPISPTIVTVKASQETALGLVIHANSITMTPGTLSIDVEPGEIEVHALSADSIADLQSGEMDKRVTRLEGRR